MGEHSGLPNDPDGVLVRCSDCTAVVSDNAEHEPSLPPAKVVQETFSPEALTLFVSILSIGGVIALIDFVHLCFAHPDNANLMVGLIFLPILQLIAKFIADRRKGGD